MSAAGPTTGNRRLTVVISADVSNFVRGLSVAQKQLQSTSRTMIAIGQNLAFGIGAPLAAISARLIKMGGDFESAGNKIVTQTQLSREQVTRLAKDVEKLSDSLTVTASSVELMKGGLAVAGAGFSDASQVMETLKKAAQLSSLGLGEMDTVARSLTAVLTSFAPQGVNAAEAANAFLLAVQEGGFPAEQFANSVARLGSSALQTDVSLQEIVATLSVYTRATGDADEATTGITRILSDIAAPSEKARKAWLNVFPLEGVLKARRLISEDMVGFLVTMARKMKEVPIEIFQELVSTFFDNERAARAFINVFGAQGPAVVETLKRIAQNTTALPKALNQMKDSWSRVFDVMRDQVDNVSKAMGEVLLPTMKTIVAEIGGWVFALKPLLTANAGLVVSIAAVTAGSIALLIILGQVGLGISALAGFFLTVVSAVGAFIGAIGSAATALSGWAALAASAFGVTLTTPFLVATGAVVAFTASFHLMSNETTELAKRSASTFTKLWAVAFALVKTMFRGLIVFMLQGWTDYLKAALEAEKATKAPFEFEVGGKPLGEILLGGAISSSERMLEDWKSVLSKGTSDIEILMEQMIFGARPRELKFPPLELPEIIVPGTEITKLKQMSLAGMDAVRSLKELQGLKIQVLDIDTKKLRDATLEELKTIQKEAATIEPIDVGVFSFDELFDRLALFKTRFVKPEDEIAGFVSRVNDLLKNLGVGMGEFKLPVDEGAANKVAQGLEKITDMLFEQAQGIVALEKGWTEFDIATQQGVIEIAKVGDDIGLTVEQIRVFQDAWRGLRQTLDATTRAQESIREVSKVLEDARGKLADLQMQGSETYKELQRVMQVFESVDLSTMTDAQIREFQRLKLEVFDVYAAIERETEKVTIDLKDKFLSALDQITRGVLAGTRSWQDYLQIFSDIGVSIFSEWIQAILKDKLKNLDLEFEANFFKRLPKAVDSLQEAIDQFRWEEMLAGASEAQKAFDLMLEDMKAGLGTFESIPIGPQTEEEARRGRLITSGAESRKGQIPGIEIKPSMIQSISVFQRSMEDLEESSFSLTETFTMLGGWISDAATGIGDFFSNLFDPDMLKNVKETIGGWFDELFNVDILGSLQEFASSALGAITGLVASLTLLLSGGKATKRQKAMRIIGIVGSIAGSLASVAGGVSGIVQGVSGLAAAAGTALQGGPQTSVSTQLPGQYQHGGIFKRPTMGIIGEAGPEAVIPIHKLGKMIGGSANTEVVVNSPHPATVRETDSPDQRRIEIIIDDVVAKSFRTGGKASQAMERSYGVRRSGGSR